jgi:hypothetical protein
MLRQTSPRVTDCLNKAVEARQLHDCEADPDKRLTYRHIEHTWCRLAHCYELMDQLEILMASKPIRDGDGAHLRCRLGDKRDSSGRPGFHRCSKANISFTI